MLQPVITQHSPLSKILLLTVSNSTIIFKDLAWTSASWIDFSGAQVLKKFPSAGFLYYFVCSTITKLSTKFFISPHSFATSWSPETLSYSFLSLWHNIVPKKWKVVNEFEWIKSKMWCPMVQVKSECWRIQEREKWIVNCIMK